MGSRDGEWGRALPGILRVGMSNVLKVISGVLVGFVLPRLLTVSDYGFCRTCTLYAAYVGLFSTGIIDGVALRWAGHSLQQLDEKAFRCISKCFLLLEGLIAMIASALGMLCFSGQTRFILIYLSLFLMTNNITSYCQTLSQITGRFGELSRFTALQSLLGALAVAGLWLLGRIGRPADAAVYLVLYSMGNVTVLALYLLRWRRLVFGPAYGMKTQRPALVRLITTGTPLMLANLCTLLLLNVDRQFVTLCFSRETYGIYAFACNVMTMVTMVISAVSTVLYPAMKRMDRERLLSAWQPLNLGVLLLVLGSMWAWFPLVPFIRWFLPAYTDASVTLRILFPGLAAASATTIIVHNYDKTLGLSNLFCLQSMGILLLSAAADGLVCALGGNTWWVSGASVVMLFLWYACTGGTLRRRFGLPMGKSMLLLVGGSCLFWLCSWSAVPLWLGACVYLTAVCGGAVLYLRSYGSLLKSM